MRNTPKGAYAHTPHKTMVELVKLAQERVAGGEDAYSVRQDITNGYDLGWHSANDFAIQGACERAANGGAK